MTCCGGALAADGSDNRSAMLSVQALEELLRSGHDAGDGSYDFVLSVPDVSCGQCISTIESSLQSLDGMVAARVNLTLRRVTVKVSDRAAIVAVIEDLRRLGYPASPAVLERIGDRSSVGASGRLLRSLAVAGFASANVMLLSVSVWSGATGATRDLFHLLSALIAIPAVAYSGQVFFQSAFRALRAGRLNMDVPISIAVLLALAMSVFETLTHGAHAYFDASVSLLFFLLIGRTLDQIMREKARNAVVHLAGMTPAGAMRLSRTGDYVYSDAAEIEIGDQIRVLAGERVPLDGVIVAGRTDIDRSIVTGESAPVRAEEGDVVEAGSLVLTGTVDMTCTSTVDDSFLSNVMRMMEAAEHGRGTYVRLADRLARYYAPVVHALAAIAFVGWLVASGDWYVSTYIAISVLIITCPCALGLAVPVAHVLGASKLFENGVLMKDGSALERLSEIDHIVFDKTGTLTTGEPLARARSPIKPKIAAAVHSIASKSTHPVSMAIAKLTRMPFRAESCDLQEVPGCGVEARLDGMKMRLGRPGWAAEILPKGKFLPGIGPLFAMSDGTRVQFDLEETLRPDAKKAVAELARDAISAELLSGDHPASVGEIAEQLGIENWRAAQGPGNKIARIDTLRRAGKKVLMIGDGLNDAPALSAGHVSMAPASASDVGRNAADFIYVRDELMAIVDTLAIARKTSEIVRQNIGIAIVYNCLAVPLAVAGFVTPLVAAVAMSASSILVVANSLRLLAFQTGSKQSVISDNPIALHSREMGGKLNMGGEGARL